MSNQTKVLIVEDSPLTQSILKHGLETDESIIVVATATNPYEARDQIIKYEPDVMTLDVELPNMNGVEFLKRLMPQWPIPTIIVSSLSGNSRQIGLDALEAGAIEVIAKPSSATGDPTIRNFIQLLIHKVKGAKRAKVFPLLSKIKEKNPHTPGNSEESISSASENSIIIAIGASTGGTQAIKKIVTKFPKNTPGTVIVQHMPKEFTGLFAKNLDKLCEMEVREAKSGDKVLPGLILVAPGKKQMRVKQRDGEWIIHCREENTVSGHQPSVDVLFESVAACAGSQAIGCILTGMGEDGARGLKLMKDAGAITYAQDEQSSVVFGMPKKAIALGGVKNVLPLDNLSGAILKSILYKAKLKGG